MKPVTLSAEQIGRSVKLVAQLCVVSRLRVYMSVSPFKYLHSWSERGQLQLQRQGQG